MVYIVFIGEGAVIEKNYFITALKIFSIHDFGSNHCADSLIQMKS